MTFILLFNFWISKFRSPNILFRHLPFDSKSASQFSLLPNNSSVPYCSCLKFHTGMCCLPLEICLAFQRNFNVSLQGNHRIIHFVFFSLKRITLYCKEYSIISRRLGRARLLFFFAQISISKNRRSPRFSYPVSSFFSSVPVDYKTLALILICT